MAEVIQETRNEFWRPPSPLVPEELVIDETIPTMAEACSNCSTEFLLGSRFCHSCGRRRPEVAGASSNDAAAALAGTRQRIARRIHLLVSDAKFFWSHLEFPAWLRYLHFHEIQSRIGLSTASLVAFIIGIACIAGALLVGLLTVRTFVDWQAIQFYRAEWLLAATASFVAGILLKKRSGN
ncbi:MAG TPA: hypothetical protein VH350_11895 [Candidatus Sulfotelmatobacter sp.]|jgi:uncharacterized membrane protein|nr:hypothetical protein [Candidatus Sulfotelmatobacter sp.]